MGLYMLRPVATNLVRPDFHMALSLADLTTTLLWQIAWMNVA